MHFLTLASHINCARGVLALARGGRLTPPTFFGATFLLESSSKKGDAYDLLWALVFGFATLNILSLVAKRIEPDRTPRMSFGEMMAVMTVIVAVFLLGWEMLYMFKVLPLHLSH